MKRIFSFIFCMCLLLWILPASVIVLASEAEGLEDEIVSGALTALNEADPGLEEPSDDGLEAEEAENEESADEPYDEDDLITIEDEEVPLISIPSQQVPMADLPMQDVPIAALPDTGVDASPAFYLMIIGASLVLAGFLTEYYKRKEKA